MAHKSRILLLLSAFALLSCGIEGRALGAQEHGRSLLGCTAISIASSSSYSEEKRSVAEAVAEAFANSDNCEAVTANAEASAEAFTTAVAEAIAETSALIEGDNCSPGSFANAKAGATAFATAISVAMATAIAEATNSNDNAFAIASPEDIKKVVETAIATAESTVEGTGQAESLAVAEAVAESVANALAIAIAEVECEGQEVQLPFAGRSAGDLNIPPPVSDPCECSQSEWASGVRTGRPGCAAHAQATNPNDTGTFCYAVGGSSCSRGTASNSFPGAYWIDC